MPLFWALGVYFFISALVAGILVGLFAGETVRRNGGKATGGWQRIKADETVRFNALTRLQH